MNYINKSDISRRLNTILLLVLRDRERTKEYEKLCIERKLNLTNSGAVRYTVTASLSTNELLKMFDLITNLVR